MKIRDYLCFLLSNIYENKLTFIMNIVLITISMCIIALSSHGYYTMQIPVNNVKKLEIAENTGIVENRMENFIEDSKFGEKLNSFIRDVREYDTIDFAGYFYKTSIVSKEFWNDERLIEINILEKEFEGLNSYAGEDAKHGIFSTLACDRELLEICNVKVYTGNLEGYENKNDFIPVVAGYSFANMFKIGDEFVDTAGKKYKIVAFLESGSRFLAGGNLSASINGVINLDYRLVIPTEMNDNSLFVSLYKDNILIRSKDIKETKKIISSIASKYGIGAELLEFSELYEDYYSQRYEEMEKWKLLLITAVLLGVLAMGTSLTVGILTNKKKYAIYIVNGIRIDVMSRLFLLENMLKVTLGIAISCLYVISGILEDIMFNTAYKQSLVECFWENTFPIVFGIGVIILIIITIVPVVCIRNLKPSKILTEAI